MPGIGRPHFAGRAVAIQRQRVQAQIIEPEVPFYEPAHFLGLSHPAVGQGIVAPPVRELGQAAIGGKDIALNLYKRYWPIGYTAIGVEDGVVTVLPTLID